MRSRLLLGLAVACAAGLVLAACGGEAEDGRVQVRTLTGSNLRFSPASISVKANLPVQITLKNPDPVDHDIVIVDLPAANVEDDTRSAHAAAEVNAAPHDHSRVETGAIVGHAAAGTTARVWFTPVQPGRYGFYCSLPGHRESGMTGTLIVE